MIFYTERGTTQSAPFYISYDSTSALLIKSDPDVLGLITYDRHMLDKLEKDVPIMHPEENLHFGALPNVTTLVATGSLSLTVIGACVYVTAPIAAVVGGQVIGSATTGAGIALLEGGDRLLRK